MLIHELLQPIWLTHTILFRHVGRHICILIKAPGYSRGNSRLCDTHTHMFTFDCKLGEVMLKLALQLINHANSLYNI